MLMKSLIALFLFVFVLTFTYLSAQQTSEVNDDILRQTQMIEKENAYILKNNVKINVIYLLMSGINVAYERRLINFLTVQVEGNYFFYYNYQPMQVFNFNVQLRLYPLARKFYAPKGLYLGFAAGYGYGYGSYTSGYYNYLPSEGDVTSPETNKSYHSPEIGMRVGYQFVWKSGLSLDLGVGWSVFPNTKGYPGNGPGFNTYFIPTFTSALGFNF